MLNAIWESQSYQLVLSSSNFMATTTSLITMDDCLDWQEQMFQQMHDEALHLRKDVQAVCSQLHKLSFKFSMIMAEWQQRGQTSSSPVGHNQREQDGFRGQNAMNIRPMRIDLPRRFEGGDPQRWIFKIQ